MNIFQICSKSPWPPKEGGPIAMNNITQGLIKAGHKVTVFAISTPKYKVQSHNIPDEYKKLTNFDFTYINTNINVLKAFLNLFSKKSYNIERFISKNTENKISEILSKNTFDIIQLEGLFVTPYINTIRKYSNAKIIIRAHNIEHLIWQRLAESCKNPVKRIYLGILAKKLRNYELDTMNKVDAIAAITPVDTNSFLKAGCKVPVISIPIGIDSNKISANNTKREFPGFFHLGSMDWLPNQEGIKWFLENIWKTFHKNFPQYKFYLAGRNMPVWLNEQAYQGIRVEGEIENAKEFMQSRTVMIVPLLSGSGMRVKIIEGMACGNAIITSSIGAEGINCSNGENILIADSPEEWITCMTKLSESRILTDKICENAIELVKKEYDNDTITEKLILFYNRIILSLR
ncbi:MAG TPA: glycosyltransferase family 4 protein [Bacteroidales bacterium]|nr:glycosyltransferase family 4 protein [Bacteroidales bacterium]HPS17494.1 glycosyltransferase family 4 protein [Bacteroidales bacterium]